MELSGGLFITGSSGFTGARLSNRLGEFGKTPLFLLRRGDPGSAAGGARIISGDLLQPDTYRTALRGSDTVLHLAAATGKNTRETYFRVNTEGTRRLLGEAKAAGVRRIVYVSTIAVRFRDVSQYPYAQSKQAAEKIVADSGLEFVILRPTLILGQLSPGLAGLRKLATAPVLPMFGDGRAMLQPIDVDDFVQAVIDAVRSDATNEIVEIGGPEKILMHDLLTRLRKLAGKAAGPSMHLPLAPVRSLLALLEPFLLPLLPVTAGQLASFSNDGIAGTSSWFTERRASMKTIDQMLAGT